MAEFKIKDRGEELTSGSLCLTPPEERCWWNPLYTGILLHSGAGKAFGYIVSILEGVKNY